MTNAELTQLERIAIENSLLLSGSGGGQLYHEQYDEHGVKIEKPMTDAELLSRYLG